MTHVTVNLYAKVGIYRGGFDFTVFCSKHDAHFCAIEVIPVRKTDL